MESEHTRTGFPGQRPGVRIVPSRDARRMTRVSLLLVAGVGLTLFAIWRLVQSPAPAPANRRTLPDIELAWRCEGGHVFPAAGAVGARSCHTCGKPAYSFTSYVCQKHGPFETLVEFGLDENEVERPVRVRVAGRSWASAPQGLTCPRCGAELARPPVDPIANSTMVPRKQQLPEIPRGNP